MKWCCIGFENMLGQAGRRGPAILVDASREHEPPRFFVQFRAVAQGTNAHFPDDVPISLVTEIGIKFCPWCGMSLAQFYAASARQLSRPELRVM
jgi:hypothetical protein